MVSVTALVSALSGCSLGGSFGSGTAATSSNSSATPSTTASGTLPNGVGQGLKDAVDAAGRAGFPSVSTHDASGRMRAQLLYTDWKVCFQTPPPGPHPATTKVSFGVVKLAESCPASDLGLVTKATGGVMPDLRGRSVRYASDALGSGTSLRFTTTSGSEAIVLVGTNWQVCQQTPAPGQPYRGAQITLVVAKYSDGGCRTP